MTFDDLCEHLDYFGVSGDTPLVFKDDEGNLLDIDVISTHTGNSTVEFVLSPSEV